MLSSNGKHIIAVYSLQKYTVIDVLIDECSLINPNHSEVAFRLSSMVCPDPKFVAAALGPHCSVEDDIEKCKVQCLTKT